MFGSMFGSGLLCPASLGYRAAWEGAGKCLMVGWRGRECAGAEAWVARARGSGASGFGTRGPGGAGDGMFFPSCTAYVPQTQYVPRHRLFGTAKSSGKSIESSVYRKSSRQFVGISVVSLWTAQSSVYSARAILLKISLDIAALERVEEIIDTELYRQAREQDDGIRYSMDEVMRIVAED